MKNEILKYTDIDESSLIVSEENGSYFIEGSILEYKIEKENAITSRKEAFLVFHHILSRFVLRSAYISGYLSPIDKLERANERLRVSCAMLYDCGLVKRISEEELEKRLAELDEDDDC
ncbi:hypothetical protein A9Q84_14595 [Halobacteriovorax marinus]|uniref:Uncharacterized protein n=1 Tax=Halobacteriovorax marinus TaxID=97084 RepID=A0A1Y5F4Y8_9BACT|nr:hypothetical protein A9Q84_14595 [Halobacteriovorax marinus]